MILGYAGCRRTDRAGIARLSDAIDDALDDPSADMIALFVRGRAVARAAVAAAAGAGRASGPPLSSPTGSTGARRRRQAWRAVQGAGGQRRWSRSADLSLSDQGPERAAVSSVELEAGQAVPVRPHLRPGAARRSDRPRRAEMGQEGPVRDADARRELWPA